MDHNQLDLEENGPTRDKSYIAEAESQENLAPTVARGVLWAYLTFAGSKALVFASTVVLARVLTPADFGIVGFATIVTDYLGTLQDFGVGQALIQRKDRIEEAANATFVISILSGLVLFALAVMLAPWAATFFNEPLVTPLLSVLALSYIISSFGTVHDALLIKNLDFRQRIIPQVMRACFKGGAAVALALAGFGVWAIVLGQLAGSVAETITLWIMYRWRPTRAWDSAVFRQVISFGTQIIALGFIGNIEANLDYVIIGKRLGDTALGLYTLAFRAPELLIINLVAVIADVVFPAFSKIQDDKRALQRTLLGAMHYISLVAVPAGIGLALISGPFIHVFYTGKWSGAITSMQVLSVYASLRAMTYNVGDVYKAIGRADVLNKLGIVNLLVLVPAMWLGADYGILGVSVAHVIGATFSLVVELFLLWKLLGVPPSRMTKTIWGPIVSTLGMAAVMLAIEASGNVIASGVLLPLLVIAGGAAYLAVAWLVNRRTVESAVQMILHLLGRRPRVQMSEQ